MHYYLFSQKRKGNKHLTWFVNNEYYVRPESEKISCQIRTLFFISKGYILSIYLSFSHSAKKTFLFDSLVHDFILVIVSKNKQLQKIDLWPYRLVQSLRHFVYYMLLPMTLRSSSDVTYFHLKNAVIFHY